MQGKKVLIAGVIASVAAGTTIFVLTRKHSAAPPVAHVVVGLGDSVAAGHGLGPSTGYPDNSFAHPALVARSLGWPSYNFAMSGACAVSIKDASASPDTAQECSTSVLSDELPRAEAMVAGQPALIIVGVGANDIRFAGCGQTLISPLSFMPCTPESLRPVLGALEHNLGAVLREIHRKWPASRVVMSTYYNMLPDAPTGEGDVCPMYEPIAMIRRPLSLLSDAALRSEMRRLQIDVHDRAQALVDALNGAIRAAAASGRAGAATVDFTGHDMCRTLTGGTASDVWVWGPDVDISLAIDAPPPIGRTRRWKYALPGRCPDLTGEPPAEDTNGTVRRRLGGFGVAYSVRIVPNCVPHPTAGGQAALADAVLRMLPRDFAQRPS